jgi:hypothetical protein
LLRPNSEKAVRAGYFGWATRETSAESDRQSANLQWVLPLFCIWSVFAAGPEQVYCLDLHSGCHRSGLVPGAWIFLHWRNAVLGPQQTKQRRAASKRLQNARGVEAAMCSTRGVRCFETSSIIENNHVGVVQSHAHGQEAERAMSLSQGKTQCGGFSSGPVAQR